MSTRRQLVDARVPPGVAANDPTWGRLRELIDTVNRSTLLPGRLITDEDGEPSGTGLVFVGGTARLIPHKLGRKAVGFLEITGVDLADGVLKIKSAAFPKGATSDHFISVIAGVSGRCFIWVF